LIALGLAALAGGWSLYAVLATIGATYLYNSPLKATALGPLLMGVCRFGNACIGLSLSESFCSQIEAIGPYVWFPSLTLLYILCLTWIARYETMERAPRIVNILVVVQILIAALPGLLVVFSEMATTSLALSLSPLAAIWLLPNLGQLGEGMSAVEVRSCVMRGIMGVAVLNGAMLAAMGQFTLAAITFSLLVPGRLVGRWFYAT
jgi:hypothetical protein